ncbi:MAG: plasmid pRiA4b ORF-3 family protein [Ignavibacteria bacterium]|nr:plasmid pRiA4b ORF-3 family protein [Ignavibacteria bacterium]
MVKALIVPSESSIYQMKIVLEGIKPPIWRRFLVACDIKLSRLHRVIQKVMGWENSHLHEFRVGRVSFGEPSPDYLGTMLNAKKVELRGDAQNEKDRLKYIYDFGDGWEHNLIVEKIVAPETGKHYPICLAGERSCPPEDCGGIGGYAMLLTALSGPKTADERDLVEWAGDFDPNQFDLVAINGRLKRMR